ncbi:hypothetical protein T226_17825 [Pseudomonas aeruginosa LESlike4]|nr:hypothetical protein T226_17825 [Pseudomonas aeruginosa LESlike4]
MIYTDGACKGNPGRGGWGALLLYKGAGFYLLVARKLVVGLRPLRQSKREPRGQLVPMPVAKVSRRDSEI